VRIREDAIKAYEQSVEPEREAARSAAREAAERAAIVARQREDFAQRNNSIALRAIEKWASRVGFTGGLSDVSISRIMDRDLEGPDAFIAFAVDDVRFVAHFCDETTGDTVRASNPAIRVAYDGEVRFTTWERGTASGTSKKSLISSR
jgi:hypothetical protein